MFFSPISEAQVTIYADRATDASRHQDAALLPNGQMNSPSQHIGH
jgi:hypothetical protein